LDGEVYEENDIIYCDNCDVAVHQLCYGVENVPEGSWYLAKFILCIKSNTKVFKSGFAMFVLQS
jgi:hypothetical protein